jgi:pimeloyl-ACP methyl ester carboxylesterase
MQRDIEFDAEGTILRGWLFTPDEGEGPWPTVIMCHGISCVKEMYLDDFARAFADAGFACIAYDNRGFGASDGLPRGELSAWAQVNDYRHATTYALSLTDVVDRDRIGFWGVSYAGGVVLAAAAFDRRCKCVASLVPGTSGYRMMRRFLPPHAEPVMRAGFDADRERRFRGEPAEMIPVVSEDPTDPYVVLPQRESYEFFTKVARERAPAWRNEITLRSIEMTSEFEGGAFIGRISPTPVRLIVMRDDVVSLADEAIDFYESAREPKSLVLLPGNHYECYVEQFAATSTASTEWFVEHLVDSTPGGASPPLLVEEPSRALVGGGSQ